MRVVNENYGCGHSFLFIYLFFFSLSVVLFWKADYRIRIELVGVIFVSFCFIFFWEGPTMLSGSGCVIFVSFFFIHYHYFFNSSMGVSLRVSVIVDFFYSKLAAVVDFCECRGRLTKTEAEVVSI